MEADLWKIGGTRVKKMEKGMDRREERRPGWIKLAVV